MVRTIISLAENDKRWLDQYGSLHGQSTAEVIRTAVRVFQKNTSEQLLREILKKTAGVIKNKQDAAESVRQLRNEWD